ncbi:MAG TPA: YceI family protein [Gemmatimonadales bacterium]|nr:YceI family protein [Gemmatimonadales bacterium]
MNRLGRQIGGWCGVMSVVLVSAAGAQAKMGTASAPAAVQWRIDPVHSEISFRIRHLLGRVRGRFDRWDGVLVTRGFEWSQASVKVSVQARSIDTGNEVRDEDLRSDRFFAVEKFPAITFESSSVVQKDDSIMLTGLLTIKGITRPVVFQGEYHGVMKDVNGNPRIAFDGTAAIDRKEFGITWNQYLEAGTRLGDVVDLEIAIEAVRLE